MTQVQYQDPFLQTVYDLTKTIPYKEFVKNIGLIGGIQTQRGENCKILIPADIPIPTESDDSSDKRQILGIEQCKIACGIYFNPRNPPEILWFKKIDEKRYCGMENLPPEEQKEFKDNVIIYKDNVIKRLELLREKSIEISQREPRGSHNLRTVLSTESI